MEAPTNQNMQTIEGAKTEVMQKITNAAERWASQDPMGYVDNAAEDIVWMDDLGAQKPVIGKEALQEYLATFKGQVPAHEFNVYDFNFQFYGDIILVVYRYQGTLNGEELDPWKISSVYRHINGNWLSVHENWTEVKKQD